jgi:TonB family protein
LRGKTVVALFLAPSGKVDHVTLMQPVQPLQPALDQAVLDAAMQWEWEPTFVNGVAHPIRIIFVVDFERLAERLEPQQQPPQQQR